MNYEHLRKLLAPWGALKPQPASDWTGDFSLPQVVAAFYENVGPWGKIVHAHHGQTGLRIDARLRVDIPPLSRLWDFQAGFRWDGNTRERVKDWKDEWLLVAYAEADPFILDISTGQVLFAFHGAGGWYPKVFAPDLVTAFGALATIANTKARLGETEAFIDEESFEVLPAATQEVEDDLAAFLGGRTEAVQILKVLEWD